MSTGGAGTTTQAGLMLLLAERCLNRQGPHYERHGSLTQTFGGTQQDIR